MKKISQSLACYLVLLVLLVFAAEATAQKKGKIPAAVDKALGGMVYFDSCTFRAGIMDSDLSNVPDFHGKPDTFLLSLRQPKRIVKTEDFFIGETEITNKQYREFVAWVRDSVAHCILGHYYVDEKGKQRVDWKKPLDWKVGGPLDGMFYSGYEQIGNERNLDVRKLEYQFQIYGMSVDGQLNVQELIDGLTTDEKMYTKRSIRIYPDTLSWLRDFSYSYNEPMSRNYFNHPAFDDYPVVGIPWLLAMAYCDWKTAQVNATLAKKGQSPVYIRLPYEHEWERAVSEPIDPNVLERHEGHTQNTFPWNGSSLIDKKGFYKANFGAIRDVSGFWLKDFTELYRFEDEKLNPKKEKKTEEKREKKQFEKSSKIGINKINYKNYNNDLSNKYYTTKVKKFPSYNGLYDMSGNVAEWTMDDAKPNYFSYDSLYNENFAKKIIEDLNLSIEPKFLANYFESADTFSFEAILVYLLKDEVNNEISKAFYDEELEREIYNASWREHQLLKYQGTKKIAKGGSWASGIVYLMKGARAVHSKDYDHCYLGFRIAFSPAKE